MCVRMHVSDAGVCAGHQLCHWSHRQLLALPARVLGTAPSLALITAKSSISLAHCAGFVPEMAMGNPSRTAICYNHAAQSVLAPTTMPVT